MQSNITQVWAILHEGRYQEVAFPDQSSLDAITRQLPDGFYSTFRTYGEGTRVIGLKAHLRRLYEPVPAPDVEENDLRKQLSILLKDYIYEARVRIVMTEQGQVYLMLEPLRLLPCETYEKGVRVETTDMARNAPRLKSTVFITASNDERVHIAQKDIFEALLVKNGRILEGMTSNFFYVKDALRLRSNKRSSAQHELCTTQRDILLGVTRRTVLRVARGLGLEVKYQPLKRDQLNVAREAFITSSSRGIVPVIQIDDMVVGQGRPGQITRQLSAAYNAYVLTKAEQI